MLKIPLLMVWGVVTALYYMMFLFLYAVATIMGFLAAVSELCDESINAKPGRNNSDRSKDD